MSDTTSSPFGRRRLLGGAAALALAPLSGGPTSSAAITPQPASAFVRRTISVTDAGQVLQRHYLIHVPLIFPRVALPAVIVFHGGGQTADDMVKHWESLVSSGFVIVLPQALVDPVLNKTAWRQARPGDVTVPTTDLAFVQALLTHLGAGGEVDLGRVYAAGFSSGAGMTWQLSLLNGFVNRFKGFAPVSKQANSAQRALADPAAAATPKPLIYIHGTADDNWSPVYNTMPEPLPPHVVTEWLLRNRSRPAAAPVVYACAAERPVDPIAIEQLYVPNPAVTGSTAVCFLTVVNGGHCWPLTGSDPSGRGLVCRDFDASRRMVAFWNTYAGMGLAASPAWRVC